LISHPLYYKVLASFGILFGIVFGSSFESLTYASQEWGYHLEDDYRLPIDDKMPRISDPGLKLEVVAEGLEAPTTMAFLGPDDILVLEKNRGTVQRIVNGQILDQPLLDANVANKNERGMLGIAIVDADPSIEYGNKSDNNHSYAFLFFTNGETKDGVDKQLNGPKTFRNSLYRYELDPNQHKLINPKLLLEMPTTSKTYHNGGDLLAGPDNNVYVITGDLTEPYKTQGQNMKSGTPADGGGGILRITQDGKTVGGPNGGILGNTHPIDKYYAYGIRNGFGMDFDPLTGKLWDTENGPLYGDEINLVEPGFNSGWARVQGVWQPTTNFKAGEVFLDVENLVDFSRKGIYSSPEFIWKETVGSTAIKFLKSDRLGKGYENDLFVGDINNGYLYHFELNENRTALDLAGWPLADRIANNQNQLRNMTLAQIPGGITDLEVGPRDGYLYIVAHHDGKIFRIVPSAKETTPQG
jgi:glucose/arabinose dehydrogenase